MMLLKGIGYRIPRALLHDLIELLGDLIEFSTRGQGSHGLLSGNRCRQSFKLLYVHVEANCFV